MSRMPKDEREAMKFWRSIFEPLGFQLSGYTGMECAQARAPDGSILEVSSCGVRDTLAAAAKKISG
jgi:hypothetical protein